MQAVTHLSTLKSLDIVLDTDNVYTDDGLFECILKLQGTTIQELSIHGIRHLSPPMCDAIANLKFLKRFRSAWYDKVQVVDGPALIKMVKKSESLTHIELKHITLTGIKNPLKTYLTRQLNGFRGKILVQYRHGSSSSSEAGLVCYGLLRNKMVGQTEIGFQKQESINKCSWRASP
ncbi:hypothetical protein BDA99DRAFT_498329 [Phascolomyces articulosus]|uniref:Uncharacterized protein n=1 Tax=Phascolomyces articulosus TaxID=60185 RepID=A0AAD5KLK9_9FUNG|nr:hypothetical protein BDA99DRAFT_498329 [Phascolomyces articulosus]